MEVRKIQRSGTTYYVYLPASWCREHNIDNSSLVYLDKTSKGDLLVQYMAHEKELPSLEIELPENNPEMINKTIIASYINPLKSFKIMLDEPLSPEQILEHKKLLGGLELVDFEEDMISCHTTLSLHDPRSMITTIVRKIISIIKLKQKGSSSELISRYEEEVDKSNLLIHKAIISALMYKRDSKLTHIELYYLGMLSKTLEQLTDTIICIESRSKVVEKIHGLMHNLQEILGDMTQMDVLSFIKEVASFQTIEVKDLNTYYQERSITLMGHIGEILADWLITARVENP